MATNRSAKQRVTLFLDPLISKQAKAQAVVDGVSLASLVEKALNHYLPKVTQIKKVETKGGENK